MVELLSRTIIKKYTCSFIPLCGFTSRLDFNKVNHRCIQQGLPSTSYALVTMPSLGLQKCTADMASLFMEFIVYCRETCIRCPLYVRQYERKGLEDTVLAQIGDMSPFPSIWEETESKTDDRQQYMNITFLSIWEGTLEYSSQHLPPRRSRRATCELSFSKTFEDVKLWIALTKKRHNLLRKYVEFCS